MMILYLYVHMINRSRMRYVSERVRERNIWYKYDGMILKWKADVCMFDRLFRNERIEKE